MPLDPKMQCDNLAFIQKNEGCVLHAYPDAGGYSIGYGHHSNVSASDTCTQEQADEWLREDIAHVEDAINTLVNVRLRQNEFDALCDFCYNAGTAAFAESTLLRLLNASDYQGAASQFTRWVYSGGRVNPGLVARREAEMELFLS